MNPYQSVTFVRATAGAHRRALRAAGRLAVPASLALAVVVAAWVPVGLLALPQSGQAAAPGVDSATLEALLKAAPGTYVVTDGRLAPAEEGATVPVFVQADAYRRTEGTIQVPLAVGAEVAQAWVMRLRVSKAGEATTGRGSIAAEESVAGEAGKLNEIREFTLNPGNYETGLAVVRRGAGRSWIGTVVKQPLAVPDLWGGGLVVTPIVLGEKVAAARPEEPGRPFTFGTTGLTPATVNRFRQADDLHLAFRIYGWKGDTNAKPDLTIDYVVYQQIGEHLRFFNKTQTQLLNTTTLGGTFDGSSGAVTAGMSVPLVSVPPGEFELTVRILDKRTQSSVAQKVRFFVVA